MERNLSVNKRIFYLNFAILIVTLSLIYLLEPWISFIFESENRTIIHLLIEMTVSFVTFAIFLYGWSVFPFKLTLTYLILPAVFLSIGILNMFHAITYPGMPYFLSENSIEKGILFGFVDRLTESIGIFLLIIVMLKDRKVSFKSRNWILCLTIVYSMTLIYLVFKYANRVPLIAMDDTLSIWTNYMYGLVSGIYLLSILLILKNLKHTDNVIFIYLLNALFFLLMRSLLGINLKEYQDYYAFMYHIFKILGYSNIFIGFYYLGLKWTFVKQERVEKELSKTQDLMESFFANTPEGMLILDDSGKILHVNKGFEKMIGQKERNMVGKDLGLIIDNAQGTKKVLEEAFEGKDIFDFEVAFQPNKGKTIYLLITFSPIRNKDDIVNIAVNVRNNTNQKRVEEKLRKARQDLINTIRQQQGIIFKFHKVNDYFVHTLYDGNLLYELGQTPRQIIGKEFKPPFEEQEFYKFFSYYQQAWEGSEISFNFEWKERILTVSLKPIIRESIITEVVGSIIEITQLKKTEELLIKSEKLAVVGELAAGIAHEIRNPLTTLKGFTKLLEKEVEQDRKPVMELMKTELDRIEVITNDFMVIAKPQAVTYKVKDLRRIIEHVLHILEPQAKLNNVQISTMFTFPHANVLCDENQMKQVFINIVKNALEAMPNGGTLIIQCKETNDRQVCISITDTGCGIPKEIIPKLGQPFYTLKEKGTGLGLMVSLRIIETHQGKVEFLSEINKGTTVTITLPHGDTPKQN